MWRPLALEFLRRGLVRNTAGKAFQAWRALMAALLRLELDKLKSVAKTEEERWLEAVAVPRVPTGRMKALSQMLEEVGHARIALGTALALNLHDYQYHGPDPDMALSKYRTRGEAARDVVLLLRELVVRVEAVKYRVGWSLHPPSSSRQAAASFVYRASLVSCGMSGAFLNYFRNSASPGPRIAPVAVEPSYWKRLALCISWGKGIKLVGSITRVAVSAW
ncbi:PaREP1 [Pyrobaculum ferrireducens]|uniref:PaREP1 n=1 Tax=Pyrobaculum ferrireducens TaxID=1104324 RepID=G7VE41_9CREN|nr:PaREP1 [Pyrobaculum ferrireducens]